MVERVALSARVERLGVCVCERVASARAAQRKGARAQRCGRRFFCSNVFYPPVSRPTLLPLIAARTTRGVHTHHAMTANPNPIPSGSCPQSLLVIENWMIANPNPIPHRSIPVRRDWKAAAGTQKLIIVNPNLSHRLPVSRLAGLVPGSLTLTLNPIAP